MYYIKDSRFKTHSSSGLPIPEQKREEKLESPVYVWSINAHLLRASLVLVEDKLRLGTPGSYQV